MTYAPCLSFRLAERVGRKGRKASSGLSGTGFASGHLRFGIRFPFSGLTDEQRAQRILSVPTPRNRDLQCDSAMHDIALSQSSGPRSSLVLVPSPEKSCPRHSLREFSRLARFVHWIHAFPEVERNGLSSTMPHAQTLNSPGQLKW